MEGNNPELQDKLAQLEYELEVSNHNVSDNVNGVLAPSRAPQGFDSGGMASFDLNL
jgi:hypothetical protein